MDKQIAQWLGDYVVMMEANLGALSESRIPGLYKDVVNRVIEIRAYLKQQGYEIEGADSARGDSNG